LTVAGRIASPPTRVTTPAHMPSCSPATRLGTISSCRACTSIPATSQVATPAHQARCSAAASRSAGWGGGGLPVGRSRPAGRWNLGVINQIRDVQIQIGSVPDIHVDSKEGHTMPMFSHRSALAAAALLTLSSTASFGLPPANPATCGTPDTGQCGLLPGGVPPDPPWDKPGIQDGVKTPVIGGHGDTRKDIKHPPVHLEPQAHQYCRAVPLTVPSFSLAKHCSAVRTTRFCPVPSCSECRTIATLSHITEAARLGLQIPMARAVIAARRCKVTGISSVTTVVVERHGPARRSDSLVHIW
jgi:hypothetical protein